MRALVRSRWAVQAALTAVVAVLLLPLLASAQERSHQRVLAAFRDVVKESMAYTAQILSNDSKIALGTIVGADGYVLTKASELDGKLVCQLSDGRKFDATICGVDSKCDLALLKIDATALPVVAWATGEPQTGSILASTGLHQDPIAVGVMSSNLRRIPAPAGALGIQLADNEGVATIESVKSGSPADKAGIKGGDEVLKVNSKSVTGRRELVETIRSYQPGETVALVVRRDGKEQNFNVKLGKLEEIHLGDNPERNRADFQNSLGGKLSERRQGFPIVLQHDTVLRPQDCGGPLVDLDGKAVGVNIARAGRVESYALPAAEILKRLPDLLSGKLAPPAETAVAGTTKPAETATPATTGETGSN